MNSLAGSSVRKKDSAYPPAPREDHRVRVARQKRERMRSHLLQAILIVCAGQTISDPAVIDDVVREAKVARGTFYKYFKSLEEAVDELGATLADEMTIGIYPLYNVLDKPLQRVATGFLLFLCRAIIDPNWGGFVSHIGGKLTTESVLVKHISTDIRLGAEAGYFRVASVEAAADLVLGMTAEAARRISNGNHTVDYARIMTGIVLRGLGTPPAKADHAVAQAYTRLCREAPRCIPWWKPIE
jgi:AcrR family transcriptional regulator